MKDANQMGAAMAPAAVDTLLNHFEDTGRSPDYYDIILTGDLGCIGKDIAIDLMSDAGLNRKVLTNIYDDCGTMIYEKEQDVHSGGSGCGCAASVLAEYLLPKLENGEWKRILFVPTGALMSKVSFQEGSSVPGIAQAVVIEREEDV